MRFSTPLALVATALLCPSTSLAGLGAASEDAPCRALTADDVAVHPWRSLGPTTFGGRIVDLAAHPDRDCKGDGAAD